MLLMILYVQASVSRLRAECSQYILTHSDEFLPYLVDPNTGDQFTQGGGKGQNDLNNITIIFLIH